jgi:hypothetical protein
MSAFLGVNKRVNRNDISPLESPDAVNCFFHENKLATLGPREGKTFVNSKAYEDIVLGRVRFRLPDGTDRSVIATNNGDSFENESLPASMTTYLTGDQATGKTMTSTSLTLTNPATTASLNTTFDDSSTFDPDASLFASWGFAITATGNSGWTAPALLRLEAGINENGAPKYLWTLDWTTGMSLSWVLSSSFVMAAVHAARDTITGSCWRLSWPNGWPAGAGGGDTVQVNTLLMG